MAQEPAQSAISEHVLKLLPDSILDHVPGFLKISIFGNTLIDYCISLFVIILLFGFVRIIRSKMLKYVEQFVARYFNSGIQSILRILSRNLLFALSYGAFYVGIHQLDLTPSVSTWLNNIGIVVIFVAAIRVASHFMMHAIDNYRKMRQEKDTDLPDIPKGIGVALNIILWGVGIIFVLDNIGFNVSSVVAGLGIGGVAVALASQAVLGDLFSYFVILFDRPFEIDDFVIFDDKMGTIEKVGIKSTRIRSLSGEQITISNTDLTSSRIQNFKRMQRRRVVFTIGVTYDTTADTLEEIPGIIKGIIESVDGTEFDRSHFLRYGDFSLNFESVYYVLTNDYTAFADIHQQVNLALKRAFDTRGIEFAFPTQTIMLAKPDGASA